jgi:hypothetical protein
MDVVADLTVVTLTNPSTSSQWMSAYSSALQPLLQGIDGYRMRLS